MGGHRTMLSQIQRSAGGPPSSDQTGAQSRRSSASLVLRRWLTLRTAKVRLAELKASFSNDHEIRNQPLLLDNSVQQQTLRR